MIQIHDLKSKTLSKRTKFYHLIEREYQSTKQVALLSSSAKKAQMPSLQINNVPKPVHVERNYDLRGVQKSNTSVLTMKKLSKRNMVNEMRQVILDNSHNTLIKFLKQTQSSNGGNYQHITIK